MRTFFFLSLMLFSGNSLLAAPLPDHLRLDLVLIPAAQIRSVDAVGYGQTLIFLHDGRIVLLSCVAVHVQEQRDFALRRLDPNPLVFTLFRPRHP